ncbi:MAG: serine/threonine-protein kinase, partial [Planctomycetota bacterium]
EMPAMLGGYRILQLLGRGAMGAVYKARQISLDRDVALKVIRGRWAANPLSIARFVREAYAAAQLTHHNVVQIYDFGEDAGQHYFSMEWVRGGPLSDVVKQDGALPVPLAVGYVLQAARGLRFAHRNGMVHRDVKPGNLLLDDEGIVKVADLGLVKVPDMPDESSLVGAVNSTSGSRGDVTTFGTAVGTPAYMAPEQTRNAATVDYRADVYSLGCTLYHLLAGRPPFTGKQLTELFSHHESTPVPAIQSFNAEVPDALDHVLNCCLAKSADERYQDLREMIDDLQQFLDTSQQHSPLDADAADQFANAANQFAAGGLGRLRGTLGMVAIVIAAMSLLILPFSVATALFLPAAVMAGYVAYFSTASFVSESVVVRRSRQWIWAQSPMTWFTAALGGIVAFMSLWFVGGLTSVLCAAVLGSMVGVLGCLAFHRLLSTKRASALRSIEKAVRDARIAGTDEPSIRQFVAQHSGPHWEEPFEAMFGYDAMRQARADLHSNQMARGKKRLWPIRDWFVDWATQRIDAAKSERERRRLAVVEEQGLRSEGVSSSAARQLAQQMADAVIQGARVEPGGASDKDDRTSRVKDGIEKRARMKRMLAEARAGNRHSSAGLAMPLLNRILGAQPRFLLGCLLLIGFGSWAHKNHLFDAAAASQRIQQVVQDGSVDLDSIAD